VAPGSAVLQLQLQMQLQLQLQLQLHLQLAAFVISWFYVDGFSWKLMTNSN
jgi:hypothetical protein